MDYYKLTVGTIVTLYDTTASARKAFHQAVNKVGINNVSITKVTV